MSNKGYTTEQLQFKNGIMSLPSPTNRKQAKQMLSLLLQEGSNGRSPEGKGNKQKKD